MSLGVGAWKVGGAGQQFWHKGSINENHKSSHHQGTFTLDQSMEYLPKPTTYSSNVRVQWENKKVSKQAEVQLHFTTFIKKDLTAEGNNKGFLISRSKWYKINGLRMDNNLYNTLAVLLFPCCQIWHIVLHNTGSTPKNRKNF